MNEPIVICAVPAGTVMTQKLMDLICQERFRPGRREPLTVDEVRWLLCALEFGSDDPEG